jgi:DNA-binding PadR family transcriptional regulator
MLELAILGLLKEQPLHGYELKKQLETLFGPVSRFSYGSLYPALSRLETAGAVSADTGPREPAHVPVPMTGSLSGELAAYRARKQKSRPQSLKSRSQRNRRVYTITKEGERLFGELLAADEAATTEDDRAFRLRLAFARYLPANDRMALFERRRRTLLERLAETQAAERSHSFDPYAAALMQHTTEETKRDLTWIDKLIQLETQEA